MSVLASASTSAFDQPGTLGFLVVAGMGVVLVFLFRSMTRHLRKVSGIAKPGSPGPADAAGGGPEQADPGPTDPGLAGTVLADPGLAGPGLAGPGLAGPGQVRAAVSDTASMQNE